jgi:signal transduction histidine kinase/CheY-like chemotaxis protein
VRLEQAVSQIGDLVAEVCPGATCAIRLFGGDASDGRPGPGACLAPDGGMRHDAPLEVDGRAVGILTVSFPAGAPVTAKERALVDRVATQAGMALWLVRAVEDRAVLVEENAGLRQREQVRTGRLRNLARLNQLVSSSLQTADVLGKIAQAAAELMDAPLVSIWSADEATQTLERAAFSADGIQLDDTAWTMAFGHGGVGWVATHRRLLDVPDVFQDDRIVARDWFRRHRFTSYFAAPILRNDALLGVLSVFGRKPFRLDADDRELLDSFVAQAGVAIGNARLYGETARRLEHTRALLEVAAILNSTLDSGQLLDRVAMKIADACHVDQCRIARLGDGTSAPAPAEVPLYREVIESRRPVVIADASTTRLVPSEWVQAHRLKSCMTVPLIHHDAVVGMMSLDFCEKPGPFHEWQVDLALTIANQLALSLENARLFEERTRAYADLAAAQDQLVRTAKLRALGEMASGIAHDFNNLLAAILGRTQLLLLHATDAKLRESLGVIERAAMDGAHAVRRLQELTRIRRDHAFVAVDLNEVVREAIEITQPRWQEQALRGGINIELRAMLAPLPRTAGEPAELREVLTNLILNAVDAMPDGGVLELSTAVTEDAVEVAVRDTGIGIPESAREKIFDPFYTTKGLDGTGLGLSMTYGIVSRHGGRITVESAEGRGSTFRLTFPLAPGTAPAAPPGRVAPAAIRPLRCLVVDDQEAVGTALGDLLETHGHSAVVVGSGAEAIGRFRGEPFDVVFTDLAMPRVSGWQVARAVHTIAPKVPVFVLTGFGVEVAPEECRMRGVEAILTKPVHLDDILAALARAAQLRPARTSSASARTDGH